MIKQQKNSNVTDGTQSFRESLAHYGDKIFMSSSHWPTLHFTKLETKS